MNIHIATVGVTKEPILAGLQHFRAIDINKVYLITSKDCKHVALNIKKSLSYDVEILDLINPFDKDALNDIISLILNIYKKHSKDIININITGGTNLMAAAALASAYFIKANAYYILDTRKISLSNAKVDLPIPKISFIDSLSNKKKEIIKAIGKTSNIKNISKFAEKINISKQSFNVHIKDLTNRGLVVLDKSEKEYSLKLTKTGEITLQFLK